MNPPPAPELAALVGKQIVIDTDSNFVYVGTLFSAGADFLTLENVDVHDTADSKSTKEQYAHEAKKLGARSNRKLTHVRMARVVSISLLDDIITF